MRIFNPFKKAEPVAPPIPKTDAQKKYQAFLIRNAWIDEQFQKLIPEELREKNTGTPEEQVEVKTWADAQGLRILTSEDGLTVEIWKGDQVIAREYFAILLK